jgi:hypothetical protein
VKGLVGFLFAVLLLVGCRKDIQNTAAVRQGILDYLAKRPDLVAMDVSVSSVAFRKDEADATVFFRAKDGPAENGMQMKYILERKGNQWVVKGRAGSGGTGNPHGGALLNGMPTGEAANPHGASPPGTPALPPGHPPISPKQP